MKKENPWKTLSEKEIYDNAWIHVSEHQVINPRGGKGIYGLVSMKNLAIGIIPLDENQNTWLVGQYRYPLEEYSWEIPMGGGTKSDTALQSAMRELKEETGLTAGKWTELMKVHTSNSVTDETGFVFLAEELSQGETEFDETEDLQIKKLPFKVVYQMTLDGEITDAISVCGILKAGHILGL
ncbi:NUDIX hydrolase [Flammeovirgaceae bacterium SG7u.111]|nr:NUDIX hydrolase [Flammeovirgaceae bacterium SG7u.132]WPO33408.1 NUDIX hydrolase [Flammeovirgaceae bacterium SG7u.111]